MQQREQDQDWPGPPSGALAQYNILTERADLIGRAGLMGGEVEMRRGVRLRAAGPVLLVLAILLAGCGSGQGASSGSAPAGRGAPAGAAAQPASGEAAPAGRAAFPLPSDPEVKVRAAWQ